VTPATDGYASRMQVYRARPMAELPEDLFERLLDVGVLSAKALAQIALAVKRGDPLAGEAEHCPHCGGLLRRRLHVSAAARAAIRAWLTERAAE
jgi:hypothetical protein